MSDRAWEDGDRVRLIATSADGWTQPFRKFAIEGREGTLKVGQIAGTRGQETLLVVTFDVKRKGATPVREPVRSRDIELAPTERNAEDCFCDECVVATERS